MQTKKELRADHQQLLAVNSKIMRENRELSEVIEQQRVLIEYSRQVIKQEQDENKKIRMELIRMFVGYPDAVAKAREAEEYVIGRTIAERAQEAFDANL